MSDASLPPTPTTSAHAPTGTEPAATCLRAWIEGVGIIAPGLSGWPDACAVLRGDVPWASAPTALPTPALLPAAERRRASRIVKATLAAGLQACQQAGRAAASLPCVFASSGGDGHNCHALCELLAGEDRQVSPTRFHNSVHNAACGYWSIATGATAAAQVLSAHDASFAAGLIEAMTQVAASGLPLLLVAGDSEYPEPLHAKRPIFDTSALALVLAPAPTAAALAELRLPCRGALAEGPADTLCAIAPRAGQRLEHAAHTMPPLCGLPLLAALLGPPDQSRHLALHYLPPQALHLQVIPLNPLHAASHATPAAPDPLAST